MASRAWSELTSDLRAAQTVVALTGLDGDLLALTNHGERVEAHRVGADAATTLLSEVRLQPNLVFDTGFESNLGSGIVIPVPDPFERVPVGDITLNTAATADSIASESSPDYVELATADGIEWYQNPDPDQWTIAAANQGQVLLTRREYVADWFEVIDLEGGAGEG